MGYLGLIVGGAVATLLVPKAAALLYRRGRQRLGKITASGVGGTR